MVTGPGIGITEIIKHQIPISKKKKNLKKYLYIYITMVIKCETFSLYPVQNKRANGLGLNWVCSKINLNELPALKKETKSEQPGF